MTALTVGMPDVYAKIESDVIVADGDTYSDVIYTTESELPDGLIFTESGEFMGTPTTAGTYDVIVTITANAASGGDDSSGSDSAGSGGETYTYPVQIVVTE